jgi:eukaryotic-like serine/threonine-protein kinase
MTPEQWSQVDALFNEIADLPAPERDARLAAVPDDLLRAEVASLLASGPLTASVTDAIAQTAASIASQPPERRFGPWRVTATLGFGGMGAVYKAVRDDRAFDKQVALKVLPAGLETPQAVERFRLERSILATLEHPNIARLIDGGESEAGASYIAMEFVDGVEITRFAANRSRREILELFLRVCSAVQYAHRALVVHRDLKPANILVTPEGEPKLLDFGIAKLLEPTAARTVTGFQALTPQYASPEQIRGEIITTSSDIYSLAVVLYELLTGRRPYTVDATSLAEIAATICTTPPAKPALDDDLDNILLMALRKEPERRYVSVSQFAADIRRYLDGLPVMAREDTLTYRTRKFVTRNRIPVAAASLVAASLIAGSIFSFHQARQAQAARSVADLQRQAAERHLAAAEAERRRAENQKHIADRERARAESESVAARLAQSRSELRLTQMVGLADRSLNDVHFAIERLPGAMDARRKIVDSTLQFLENLSKDAGNDPRLRLVLGDAYIKVAEVQGHPYVSNIGDRKGAHENCGRAVAMVQPILASHPNHPEALRILVTARQYMAGMLVAAGERDKGAAADLANLPDALRAANACPANPDCVLLPSVVYSNLAEAWRNRDSAKAIHYARLQRESVEAAARALPKNEKIRLELAIAYSKEGGEWTRRGELQRAALLLEKAVALREDYLRRHPADAPTRRNLMITYANLAANFGGSFGPNLGNFESARLYYGKALAIARDLAAADPANNLAQYDLGNALVFYAILDPSPAQLPESLALLREAETLLVKVTTAEPTRLNAYRPLAHSRLFIGHRLVSLAQPAAAVPYYQSTIDVADKIAAKDAGNLSLVSTALRAEQSLAELLAAQGDFPRALEFANKALSRASALRAPASEKDRVAAYLADSQRTLAHVHAAAGDWPNARRAAEQSLQSWHALQTSSSPAASRKDAAKAEEILRLASSKLN